MPGSDTGKTGCPGCDVASVRVHSRSTNPQNFFEWSDNHLDVNDPVNNPGRLAGYLSSNARTEVRKSFETAAERARKAIAAEGSGNHGEAKRLWRLILGDSFPS